MDWLTAVAQLRRDAAARRARHGGRRCAGTRRGRPGAKMVVGAAAALGHDRRRQPRGDRGRAGPASCSRPATPRAGDCTTASLTEQAPARARRAVLRRRGDAAARAAAPGARRRDLRRWGTSAPSWPGSWPATTSSCTWSTRAPSSSTRSGWRRSPRTPWPGCTVHHAGARRAGARRAARRQPRADHDPRPRRGRRAVRRRAAAAAQLGSIGLIGSAAKWRRFRAASWPQRATARRRSPGSPRPIGLPGDHRQGPRDDRGRASPPTCCCGFERDAVHAATRAASRRSS